ncbi:hypothetical protein Q31a_13840 [Aureliella helgolandensis]|uniref:Uncharacterized protein n=1 Tax=Aureliella helgolandensis TaxID=2527968 RepID=A0A518G3H4_9BACT|nr:hypothetical protein Q31a_13840 [Aureliella helgolandensis]
MSLERMVAKTSPQQTPRDLRRIRQLNYSERSWRSLTIAVMVAFAHSTETHFKTSPYARGQDRSVTSQASLRANSTRCSDLRKPVDAACVRLVTCSRDPIGFQGGINWFTYVLSTPLNHTDPAGLRQIRLCFGWQFDPDWLDTADQSIRNSYFRDQKANALATARQAHAATQIAMNKCCKQFELACATLFTRFASEPIDIAPRGIRPSFPKDRCGDNFKPTVSGVIITNGQVPSSGAENSGVSYGGNFVVPATGGAQSTTTPHELGHCGGYRPDDDEPRPKIQPDVHCVRKNHPMNHRCASDPRKLIVDRNYCEALDNLVSEDDSQPYVVNPFNSHPIP